MNLKRFMAEMDLNAQIIGQMTRGLARDQARWKPAPDSWSVLEVVNHLYDEEIEDFGVGLDLALHRPKEPWPSIDPEGWVTSRRYNERDLEESLSNFQAARKKSLAWLSSLDRPNWEATIQRTWGRMTAGDILAAWVAHDLLHMRQLVELKWAITTAALHPREVGYAGDW